MTRVAVYGGSFDPPHLGHYFTISYLLRCGLFDEVWVEPTAGKHPFGKRSTPIETRSLMLYSMFLDITLKERAKVRIREDEARPGATGYSLDLMKHVMQLKPHCDFRIVYGTDLLHMKHKFHNWDELCALARPVFVQRAGFDALPELLPENATVLPLKMPEISSTMIRDRMQRGESLDGLVHPNVIQILKEAGSIKSA